MTNLARLLVALCPILLLQGCLVTVPLEGDRPAPPFLVATYPEPVDPTQLPPGDPAPLPEPKVISKGEDKSALIYTCRHADSQELRHAVEGLLNPEATVHASPELNTLVISDTNDRIDAALQFIRELDRPSPQLLVEARIVEVSLDNDLEYEINHNFLRNGSEGLLDSNLTFNTPGSNPNTTQGARVNIRSYNEDGVQMDSFLRFLATKGKAKILSSPNVVVGIGEEASLITGEEVPIQSATVVSGTVNTTTQFKKVGIKLKVTPLQITHDTARVDINPEVSTVTGFTAAGSTGVSNPIVAVRNIRTTLEMKDGEILTIGGLLRSEDREVLRVVPGLWRIPLLGLLFRSQRTQQVTTQLIFFLRVTILEEGQRHTIRLHRPGGGMEGLDGTVERGVRALRTGDEAESD